MRGLYIHVPFCVRKCAYCDFYSLPARTDLVPAYMGAVLEEAQARRGMSFDTLYLGGGTPSLLGAEGLQKLIEGLQKTLDLSSVSEATVEANPDSATGELLQTALTLGIDRVSIGVQSLSDGELKSVGRVHTAEQAVQAVALAKQMGFHSISADVILGLPGQDWHSLQATLERLFGLGVDHLSLYLLSLEEGTSLAARPPSNL
ncbi:MAG: radical SAM protein, partial [Chloroflexota bacterium]